MHNGKTITTHTIKTLSLITCASAFTLLTAVSAHAGQSADQSHSIPTEIRVPDEARLFRVGHGFGTQNYVCVPSGTGVAFTLFTPQATLFNDESEQIITHFFSPNPVENGIIRVTWEDSRDTSMVWGAVTGQATVRKDSINWLRVETKGTAFGPTGGGTLTPTKFIQRIKRVEDWRRRPDAEPGRSRQQAVRPYRPIFVLHARHGQAVTTFQSRGFAPRLRKLQARQAARRGKAHDHQDEPVDGMSPDADAGEPEQCPETQQPEKRALSHRRLPFVMARVADRITSS